jgi:hypothetical protein
MAAKYHLKNRVSIITQFYPPDYAATGVIKSEMGTINEDRMYDRQQF